MKKRIVKTLSYKLPGYENWNECEKIISEPFRKERKRKKSPKEKLVPSELFIQDKKSKILTTKDYFNRPKHNSHYFFKPIRLKDFVNKSDRQALRKLMLLMRRLVIQHRSSPFQPVKFYNKDVKQYYEAIRVFALNFGYCIQNKCTYNYPHDSSFVYGYFNEGKIYFNYKSLYHVEKLLKEYGFITMRSEHIDNRENNCNATYSPSDLCIAFLLKNGFSPNSFRLPSGKLEKRRLGLEDKGAWTPIHIREANERQKTHVNVFNTSFDPDVDLANDLRVLCSPIPIKSVDDIDIVLNDRPNLIISANTLKKLSQIRANRRHFIKMTREDWRKLKWKDKRTIVSALHCGNLKVSNIRSPWRNTNFDTKLDFSDVYELDTNNSNDNSFVSIANNIANYYNVNKNSQYYVPFNNVSHYQVNSVEKFSEEEYQIELERMKKQKSFETVTNTIKHHCPTDNGGQNTPCSDNIETEANANTILVNGFTHIYTNNKNLKPVITKQTYSLKSYYKQATAWFSRCKAQWVKYKDHLEKYRVATKSIDKKIAKFDFEFGNMKLERNLEVRTWDDIETFGILFLINDEDAYIEYEVCEGTVFRVFNDNYGKGGRYYGFSLQTLPECVRRMVVIRKHMTVNGKNVVVDTPVCELDYSSLHPSILYTINNAVMPENPYIYDDTMPDERKECKLALNIMINSKDEKTAIAAIRKEFVKKLNYHKGNSKLLNDYIKPLMDKLAVHNSPIKKHFYSNAGVRLQNIDSIMATYIMMMFAERKKVITPIHDSFIVDSRDSGYLYYIMRRAYRDVLQIENATIRIKEKYGVEKH